MKTQSEDGLADQSGGAFRLARRESQGTTTSLWLGFSHQAPASILLVDDDNLIAASTSALLEDLGHQVIEVNFGLDALAALGSGLRPDLIITDHAMPGTTATQLAASVRVHDLGIPILLATGYAELAGEDGIDLPRLAKPDTQSQLSAEISRVLLAMSSERGHPRAG